MIRQAVGGLSALAAVTLLLEAAVAQQPATPDKVVLRDKEKKDGSAKTHEGFLQFGPIGLQVVGADKKVLVTGVAPADVVRVYPSGDIPGVDRSLITAEEKAKSKADYEKIRLGYEEAKKKGGLPERTKRFVEFKIAQMATRAADETGYDERWAEAAAEASKLWGTFLAEFRGGWESWAGTRAVTRVHAELNQFDEAARSWKRLAAKDTGLPPDLLVEAALQEIDANIRSKTGGAAAAAVGLAQALAKTVPAGAAKERLAIYEIAANAKANAGFEQGVKDIEKVIAEGAKDPVVRGVGYSMIGELYLAAGKPRDAMWSFLWVETVYNADRDEAFKAMCRVLESFKAQKEEDRAKVYQDKLRRARGAF
jgi:hypothetical protein